MNVYRIPEPRPLPPKRPLRCRLGWHKYLIVEEDEAWGIWAVEVCQRCGQCTLLRWHPESMLRVPIKDMKQLDEVWQHCYLSEDDIRERRERILSYRFDA